MQSALNPKNTQVLIADDNPDDVHIVSKALETFGIKRMYWADTAEEALLVLNQHACEVALVDYVLPKMNGLRLVERIRQEHPRTRVIFLTGSRDEYVAAQAIKAGAVDYLGKDELITSHIIRSLQQALRMEVAEDAGERADALRGGIDRLAEAREEVEWLIGSLTGIADRPEALQALEERWRADDVDGEQLRRFRDYLRDAAQTFPETAAREEDAIVRLFMEWGSSPRDILAVYGAVLQEADGDAAQPTFAPLLLVTKLLAQIVQQYQVRESFRELER